LNGAGRAAALRILSALRADHRIELRDRLRMVSVEPHVVVRVTQIEVVRQFHPLEAAMRAGLVLSRHAILVVRRGVAEPRFEVRFAEKPSAVAVLREPMRDRRRLFRQRHAVHPHAVGRHVLAGDDRRARRHADDVLIVRAGVVDTVARETVEHRRARHRAAVTAERVVAHLIGRDQ